MLTLIANSDAPEEDHRRTEGQLFHPRPAQGDRDEGIGGVARNRDAPLFCSQNFRNKMSSKGNSSSCRERQRSRQSTLAEPGATDTHSRNTHARFPVIRQGDRLIAIAPDYYVSESETCPVGV